LQIGAYGSTNGEITLASTTTGYGSILFGDGATGSDFYRGYLQYNHTDDAMLFATAAVERMRIDSSGNVMVNNSAGTKYVQLQPDGSIRSVHSNGGGGDSIFSAITGISNGYQISVTTGNAQTYKWHNGGTQSMTLDSSGNLYIGRTSDTQDAGISLVNNGFFRANRDGDVVMVVNRNTNDGAIVAFRRSGSTVGSIDVTTSATSYNTSSDYRLKESIAPMTGALTTVAQLKPVTYKWKSDGSDGQGFIAHELQAVVPDCVTGEKDAIDADGKPIHQGVDTSFLVATLTSAIQEQQALIESLTTRLTALEGK
jgi:hypothetical protein